MSFISIPWLLMFIGLAGLYVPTYWDLSHGIWRQDENAHGPVVFLIFIYLIIRQGKETFNCPYKPCNISGYSCLFIGLLLYILGRSQSIILLEVGSQIPIFAGILLLMQGAKSLRKAWFPLVYLVFMLPLPGIVVDTLTGILKQWVSFVAVEILYDVGYPIARDGVIIIVAQYKLLVANACSGLNSMFSLSAIGLLYMYLTGRSSRIYNGLMLISILPIAFLSNIVRIMILILITYYFGSAAGQGFMHSFAGTVLIIVAILMLFMLDSLIVRLVLPNIRSNSSTKTLSNKV